MTYGEIHAAEGIAVFLRTMTLGWLSCSDCRIDGRKTMIARASWAFDLHERVCTQVRCSQCSGVFSPDEILHVCNWSLMRAEGEP